MDKCEQASELLANYNDLYSSLDTMAQAIRRELSEKHNQQKLAKKHGAGDTIAPDLLKSVLPTIREMRAFLNQVENQIQFLGE